LQEVIANDLAVLLTERFEQVYSQPETAPPAVWESAAIRPPLPRPLTRLIGRQAEVKAVRSLAITLFARGVLATNQADAGQAFSLLAEAMPLFQEMDQVWFQAITLLHLGNAAFIQADIGQAQACMDDCYSLGQRIGAQWIIASAVNNFGELARYQGHYDQAESYYLESRALFQRIQSFPDVARANHSLGWVALSRDDQAQASVLFKEALALHQQLGVKRGVVECLVGLAALMAAKGQAEEAIRLFSSSRSQFDALGAGVWPADRVDFERSLADARVQVDEQAFVAAWDKGQLLDLAQALAAVAE
jgi:tetratricopeptide (TPR) repeat protein